LSVPEVTKKKLNLILGDCLDEMPKLEANSVNLILTDMPYGETANSADVCLPLKQLWKDWKRLLSPTGVVILTSQFPFSVDLVNSNRKWFKYDLVWNKKLVTGFLNANRQPLRCHEQILVFYSKQPTFHPQFTKGNALHIRKADSQPTNKNYGTHVKYAITDKTHTKKYPTSIIYIQKPHPSVALHPTEKPIALAEYLIKTYTNKGDTVLDCCMGVGWTAIACKRLNRNFIGIEINQSYFDITRHKLGETTICLENFVRSCNV